MPVSGTAVRCAPLHTAGALLCSLLALGCVQLRGVNEPLEQVDPSYGYRPFGQSNLRETGRIWVILAFSGGGTRAAALSYGVLEELRDTEVVVDGETVRLLDEIDMITGVSGGSFPAAYYGLYDDRIFDEFGERFLYRNVQGALVLRALIPWNLVGLMTPYLSRSDLAAGYYDKNIFDGATFADLSEVHGPRIHINATDLPRGHPFRFNQGAFDVICSDLNEFSISYAVAASSAVPFLLSPITLRNYTGTCGYEPPDWFEDALQSRETNPRGYRAAKNATDFLDADKRYIHLVDGGISDNLGMRQPIDRIAAIGSIRKSTELEGLEIPDHLVVVMVNAETEPDPAIDLQSSAPSVAASLNLVSGAQIRRYNFDTMLLAKETIRKYGEELSDAGHTVTAHTVEVGFDLLPDEDEIHYFKRMPTSFKLKDQQVDDLREVGGRLLRDSHEWQAFLEAVRQREAERADSSPTR